MHGIASVRRVSHSCKSLLRTLVHTIYQFLKNKDVLAISCLLPGLIQPQPQPSLWGQYTLSEEITQVKRSASICNGTSCSTVYQIITSVVPLRVHSAFAKNAITSICHLRVSKINKTRSTSSERASELVGKQAVCVSAGRLAALSYRPTLQSSSSALR